MTWCLLPDSSQPNPQNQSPERGFMPTIHMDPPCRVCSQGNLPSPFASLSPSWAALHVPISLFSLLFHMSHFNYWVSYLSSPPPWVVLLPEQSSSLSNALPWAVLFPEQCSSLLLGSWRRAYAGSFPKKAWIVSHTLLISWQKPIYLNVR